MSGVSRRLPPLTRHPDRRLHLSQRTTFHGSGAVASIYELLKNEVPGVRVSGTTISLLGQTTYSGSTEPLFVVDGIPVNGINDIAPADVKTVRVIKGSEAAYYGVQGANGVLVIATLRGYDKK